MIYRLIDGCVCVDLVVERRRRLVDVVHSG